MAEGEVRVAKSEPIYVDPNVSTYPAPTGCPDLTCTLCEKSVVFGGLTFDRFHEGVSINTHPGGGLVGEHIWCQKNQTLIELEKQNTDYRQALIMGGAMLSAIEAIEELTIRLSSDPFQAHAVQQIKQLAQDAIKRGRPFFDSKPL